jgi:hypothetical protein
MAPDEDDHVLADYATPITGAGRVWGDVEDTGTAGIADLSAEIWD